MTRLLFILAAGIILFASCEESSSIGNDLLNDERFDVSFLDDFKIVSQSIPGKVNVAYHEKSEFSIFSVGNLEDPQFGEKTSEVFFELDFNSNISIPDFDGSSLDSMVLVLQYDTLGYYGDGDAIHNLEVYPMIQDFTDIDTLYSNETVDYSNSQIGELAFRARMSDSIQIVNHLDSSDLKIPAQIRVRMDNSWSQELFTNSNYYADNSALDDYFTGFYLKNNPSNSALLGLNIGKDANSNTGLNRLQVYYKDTADVNKIYNFRVTTGRGTLVSVDRQGFLAQDVIDGIVDNDSLLILEAAAGYNSRITFPDLSSLEGKLINHALLKIYVAEVGNDDLDLYSPINQLLASEYNDDNELAVIKDISDLAAIGAPLSNGFGGALKEDGGQFYYELIITKRIKEIVENINDPMMDKDIIITPWSRTQLPNRSVFYGANHSTYPIKLEVTYTEL